MNTKLRNYCKNSAYLNSTNSKNTEKQNLIQKNIGFILSFSFNSMQGDTWSADCDMHNHRDQPQSVPKIMSISASSTLLSPFII